MKGTTEAGHSLTDAQRDEILARIEAESFVILPFTLPQDMIDRAVAYMDTCCDKGRAENPQQYYFSETNIVESDPVFREFLMYKPALQLSYDVFGPMFHLGQDTWRVKYHDPKDLTTLADPGSITWHSDGPVNFPQVDGRCALHTLRFGYLLSDALHDDSGTLEVIRGSHLKTVLHARRSIRYVREDKRDDNFTLNHVTVKGKAGTMVAFHNAIWHQAQPNRSDQPRKICFFQYCPTMMHSFHRVTPYPGDMSPFTDEERWLLGEPRPPASWGVGTEEEWKRMSRFRRDARDDGFPD